MEICFKKITMVSCAVFILYTSYLLLPPYILSAKKALDYDFCMDSGYCKEGLFIKNKKGERIKINKENCIENDWAWDDEKNWCDVRTDIRNCQKKGCKWDYPKWECSCN